MKEDKTSEENLKEMEISEILDRVKTDSLKDAYQI